MLYVRWLGLTRALAHTGCGEARCKERTPPGLSLPRHQGPLWSRLIARATTWPNALAHSCYWPLHSNLTAKRHTDVPMPECAQRDHLCVGRRGIGCISDARQPTFPM